MPGDSSRENGKLGGRPRLEATKLREALVRKAEEKADELADAILGKALGDERYKTADVSAHREILDRVIGRAAQQIDLTSKGESLNEKVTKLEDGQLEQLIRSVGAGRPVAPDEAPEGGAGDAPAGAEAEAA